MSTVNITSKKSRDGEKKWYYFEWSKAASQRKATGIFTYVTCKNLVQKNFNKEVLALLEIKRSQLILEHQSVGTSYIPSHIFRNNFVDYYTQYVKNNKREGNRHFKTNSTEEIRSKTNPSKTLKEFLEAEEYIKLLETPMYNQEVKKAFVVSCYTGLRFCDVKLLKREDVQSDSITTRIIQKKTNKPVTLTLHPIVKAILEKKMTGISNHKNRIFVFSLPTANGCNKALDLWVKKAGISKYITWYCARLSFSILLQDANVDTATVALMLGHTTTRHVNETYKRHRPKDQSEHLSKLPEGNWDAF